MSRFVPVKPNGYACSPNGEKRYTWPAGGEWPDPGFPLSQRHRALDIEDVELAVECAKEMEHKKDGDFNASGFSHYEIYSCMCDRLLHAKKATETQKRAICKNEFRRMIERKFSFDYFKGCEIPISQLDEHTERRVNNLLYSL